MLLRRLPRLAKYVLSVVVVILITYTATVILRVLTGPSTVARLPGVDKIYELSHAHDFARDGDLYEKADSPIIGSTNIQKLAKSASSSTTTGTTNDFSETTFHMDTYTKPDSYAVNSNSKTTLKRNTNKSDTQFKTREIGTTPANDKRMKTSEEPKKMTSNVQTNTPSLSQEDTLQKGLLDISRKMNFTLENVPGGPGEFGEGVLWQKSNLTVAAQTKWDNGYKYAGYNVYISDRIPLRRHVKDLTDPMCGNISYPPDLPQASVVVPYHKEALSALIRTVLSTLDRAPPHLLKEIILVDDFSESEQLLDPLDEFVKYLPKVHVIRNIKREGLMRSRMKGVMVATAPVIVIKDAHTEYMPGWLEPLLLTIHNNRTTIAITHVHVMSKDNFKIGQTSPFSIHVFDFNLRQVIYRIPDKDLEGRKSAIEHVPSPAMLGTEFAVNKDFFLEIGGYDPGLEIWGGEEMELSFKTWMCGGSMVIVPCSGVAHLFREAKHRSYQLNVQNDIRVAQVWLDQYKHDVYQRFGKAVENLNIGNITSRVELRKQLKCKSFDWYLQNIAPMIYVPRDLVTQGEIRSVFNDHCVKSSSAGLHLPENRKVSVVPCSERGPEQFWIYTKSGYIRKDDRCLSYVNQTDSLTIVRCTEKEEQEEQEKLKCWEITQENTIVHTPSRKCITLHEDQIQLTMEQCKDGHDQQQQQQQKQQQRQQWRITPRKGAPDI